MRHWLRRLAVVPLAALVVGSLLVPASAQEIRQGSAASAESRILAAGFHRAPPTELADLGIKVPARPEEPKVINSPDTAQDTIVFCKATGVASHETAGGNFYATTKNVCLVRGGDDRFFKPYTHAYCYRNGVNWDGCRWSGSLGLQYNDTGTWVSYGAGSYHWDCGSWCDHLVWEWVFSGPWDWIDVDLRGLDNWSAQVRFRLADDTTVLKNCANAFSQVWTGI